MIIEKIIKLKNNKYKIIFDDKELITYDNVILENSILYKKNISKETYSKIIKDTNYYDVYNKCVKSILKRRKSEKEILEYLDKYEIDDKDSIISKLKSVNLINDREYIKAYINDKVYLSKYGIKKIRNDLSKLDIDINLVDEELNLIDKSIFKENLEKLIIKRINSNTKYSSYKLKQKVLNDMLSLGYIKEDIISIIEENIKPDNNIFEKEFNKQYNKLKLKYDGYILKQKLKRNMITKGFNSNLINNKIEEINFS